ncbi:MAG: hypothetical protein NWR03_12715 [Akkermansiaceae bacterium]|nr:hypothetical protein [Akkermansiaceae bacterium]MDP4780338.1 hypothetical protein [Akkermansiaceae bacterium]MDP4898630.1 hypothetical protein [Akkermansiaceae bacterium]
MKRYALLAALAFFLPSCADEEQRKPVGPTSDSSRIPWNDPGLSPQGGGQMGMLPQNQYRR